MTDEDAKQLALLNEAVTAALTARTTWLDDHMAKYADFDIGEDLYDLDTGKRLGTVCGYYRYQRGHNLLHDTHMNIDYELHVHDSIYDNTSRHAGRIRIGNMANLELIRKSLMQSFKESMG
jgi:hypothetical protein